MCKKLIVVLTMSFCLISSVGARTVTWDFENGEDHNFTLYSTYPAVAGLDDPNTAGDEKITGMVGISRLPDAGIAWTVGPPNQFDGLKPAADVENARVDANGLLDYSLGAERIATESGTLNTYNLNQHGDYIHTQENDQIASSPIVVLDANAVLTVWSLGGGSGTHAPEYDPDVALWYTDGSSGIAVISFEEDDKYAILATLHLNGKGTLTEDTLDLSEFAGRRVFLDVVDAFEGSWGWLAIDEIQITHAAGKNAGFIVQLADGEPTMGLDTAQIDHLEMLGYNVNVVPREDVTGGVFTKADANALDLLVISESISSDDANNLIGTSAPTMHQESYGWDNWHFMGELTENNGWQTGTDVNIVNDTHPIMVDANLPLGPMTFYDPANSWTTDLASNLAPGAELLAKITVNDNDLAIVFAIEKGAELADGSVSPNRAVGFSLPGFGEIAADAMTDEAWAFFDAAIRWLDPQTKMVAHWPLDDGAGTVVTEVVGGNDGTMVGLDPATAWISDGKLGGAVRFDGTIDHHIEVPHSDAIEFGDEDFSISCWIRYPDKGVAFTAAGKMNGWVVKGTHAGPGTGNRYQLFIDNGGGVRFTIDNNAVGKSRVEVDNAPFMTGDWVHVVAVRDAANDQLLLYADGILQGTAADTSGDISNGEPLRIGNCVDEQAPMIGDIDDVIIFGKALTEQDIASLD